MLIFANLIILIISFIALIKGADFFVAGSSALAKKFHIPAVIIGLTIVSMGTSAPELAVSLSASLAGSNEIAISNVLGSNLFNLLGVLGVCSLFGAVPVEKNMIDFDIPFSAIITAILGLFCLDFLFTGEGLPALDAACATLSRVDAFCLCILFAAFLRRTIRLAKQKTIVNEEEDIMVMPLSRTLLFMVAGLAAIILGGHFTVESAKELAYAFGMSETLVGLTIVAIGTSLPELITSVVASRKGESGIAVGNVVGSNIFNILFILGISGFIAPMDVLTVSLVDIVILLAVSLLFFLFVKNDGKLSRKEGISFLVIYVAYTVFAALR